LVGTNGDGDTITAYVYRNSEGRITLVSTGA